MRALTVLICCSAFGLSGCPGPNEDHASSNDPHIVGRPDNLSEDPKLLSPPVLGHPIYACGTAVTVQGFIPGAKIAVFIDGAAAPRPSFVGQLPDPGQTHDTGMVFTAGQTVYVTQTFAGITSGPSNNVTVSSHADDYPTGLPQPKLFRHPLLQCSHAVLVENVAPNSWVTVEAEDPNGIGGYQPPLEVGGFQGSSDPRLNWSAVSLQLRLGARISATAGLCTDTSPRSDYEIAVSAPAPVPSATLQTPIVDGQEIVTVSGQATPGGGALQQGAALIVRKGDSIFSERALVPGGFSRTLVISAPATAGERLSVTQALCQQSYPSTPVTVSDCNSLPAAVINPPRPGDSTIGVTTQIPGAELLVFADGVEVGHSSGPLINLTRPLKVGETIVAEQRLGKCTGRWAYRIRVDQHRR